MNWKLHFVWPLCVAMTLTDARSATVDIVETVYYDFTFEMASGGIVFSFPWEPFWSVAEIEEPDEYTPLFGFGFFHHGNRVLELQGETLSLGSLLWSESPPAPIELAWQSFGADNSFWSLSGEVTFGAENLITDWLVFTSGGEWSAEDRRYWSDPIYVDADWRYFGLLGDTNPYIGEPIYGINDSDHYGQIYWTSPGRWITSINKYCYSGDGGNEVPCPDGSLTPVPLPPSLMLLASGLAGLGAVRRRRRLAG